MSAHIRLILLSCETMSFLLLVGCDGFANVRGHVVTSENKPIAGATVDFFRHYNPSNADSSWFKGERVVTDDVGYFDSHFLFGPSLCDHPFVVRVYIDGYRTFAARFSHDEIYLKTVRIILEPADSASNSRIVIPSSKTGGKQTIKEYDKEADIELRTFTMSGRCSQSRDGHE